MNSQSFQNIPTEMGLFTFYKQQQQEEQNRRRPQEKRKKKNKKHSKKKLRYYQFQKTLNKSKSKQKAQAIATGFKPNQFLKNRAIKNHLKSPLSKIQEKPMNISEDDFILKEAQNCKVKQHQQKQTLFEKRKPSHQMFFGKKHQLILNSPQTQPISAESIRKTFFSKKSETLNNINSFSKRQFGRQRIRTQVNYNLHRNHLEYIQSTEKQLITPNQSEEKQVKKSFIRTPIRSFKEKLQFLDSKNNSQHQAKHVSDRYEHMLINSKTSKELHQQNKRYFNNLIQDLHIQPQYNQTVYRILRETLRLPQLDKTTRHLKTQQSSPQVDKFQIQAKSQSIYKNTTDHTDVKFRKRQNSLKQRNFIKIAVKGKIISHIQAK